MQPGTLKACSTILAARTFWVQLFKNDRTPRPTDTAAMYTAADFSGYVGPQALVGWVPPFIAAGRALTFSAALQWRHNGGGVDNNIYGVFILDDGGDLWWAERDPRAPVLISPANRDYFYVARFAESSEFSG